MTREDPPLCTICGTHTTVKHILTELSKYEHLREKNGVPEHLNLGPVEVENVEVIQFFKILELLDLI